MIQSTTHRTMKAPSDLGAPEPVTTGAEPVAAHPPTVTRIRRQAVELLAHRVRTPLSLVIGPLHRVLEDTSLDDDVRTRLGVALEHARQVRDGIDELATVGSWIDDRSPSLARLGDLVADVAMSTLSAMTCDGLTYSVHMEDAVDVRVDPTLVRWALAALVTAVVDACGAEGHLELHTEGGDDSVVATVTVTSERACRPDTSRPMIDIAMMIATTYGGTVRQVGETGWELRLPSASANGGAGPMADRVDRHPLRSQPRPQVSLDPVGEDDAPLVLLVEDDAVLRRFLADALAVDHRVVVADRAEDAVSIIERVRPDLIVLDLLLPGIGGEQMLREIHGDPELAGIPVVVISGRGDDDQRVRLLRGGAEDYVTKPFSFDELRARIRNVLVRSGSLDDLRARAERAQEVADQLQRALDSRVVIEQAKAFVAADRGIGVDDAFEVLRRYARSNNRKLNEVASAVVNGFRP